MWLLSSPSIICVSPCRRAESVSRRHRHGLRAARLDHGHAEPLAPQRSCGQAAAWRGAVQRLARPSNGVGSTPCRGRRAPSLAHSCCVSAGASPQTVLRGLRVAAGGRRAGRRRSKRRGTARSHAASPTHFNRKLYTRRLCVLALSAQGPAHGLHHPPARAPGGHRNGHGGQSCAERPQRTAARHRNGAEIECVKSMHVLRQPSAHNADR